MLVTWLDEPEDHDYDAASAYLTLVDPPGTGRTKRVVMKLRDSETVEFYAKDILRASGLALLPIDNFHVAKDLQKIKDGKDLSPVLLVHGNLGVPHPLIIADGYHRVCAAYHVSENAVIRCRIGA